MKRTLPKVSVCVVTYNQEKYIRECLQSILDQEVSFDFEIVVADDCSSDGTQEILKEYLIRYPGVVRLYLHEKNIGPYKNFVFVHQQAWGEYIAHIDGDDYCLPGKLKVQADLLDCEPQCNIVWHRMNIQDAAGILRKSSNSFASEFKFYREDVLKYMSIGANSSKMYRKSVRDFSEPPFDVMDYFANVEQVGEGYARLIDDKAYGVYRAGIGISASGNRTRLILRDCFLYFSKKYPQYSAAINSAALIYFLGDLRNGRKSWVIFFVVWLKTFSLSSLLSITSHLRFSRQLNGN